MTSSNVHTFVRAGGVLVAFVGELLVDKIRWRVSQAKEEAPLTKKEWIQMKKTGVCRTLRILLQAVLLTAGSPRRMFLTLREHVVGWNLWNVSFTSVAELGSIQDTRQLVCFQFVENQICKRPLAKKKSHMRNGTIPPIIKDCWRKEKDNPSWL